MNTENTVIEFARVMQEMGIKPELEVFDRGMVQMALKVHKMGLLTGNMHFNLVLGTAFGMPAGLENIIYMVKSLPEGCTFTGTGIGRNQFTVASAMITLGGHVRVGFEDNVYLKKGILARSNGELVEKAVRMAQEFGRAIATPDEARAILGLKQP
jgi:3-keto-5-aminohexanoate cleavage enzyme